MMMNRGVLYCIGLSLVIVVLFASNLLLGSVSIPAEDIVRILLGDPSEKASWRYIILESRLPQAITVLALYHPGVKTAAGHHGDVLWGFVGRQRSDAPDRLP